MTSFARATSPPPVLSPPEQRILLKKTGETRGAEREHMVYSLTLGTGLRQHETIALNIGDVFHAGDIRSKIQLQVFKGANRTQPVARSARPIRQIVYLPRLVRRKLAYFLKWKKTHGESLKTDAPLFCASQAGFGSVAGDRISTRTIRFHFRRWQSRCGFEQLHGFHVLRHTALSNIYRVTKDILVVKAQARHANVTTTQIYMHVDDDVRKAVEDLPC